MSSTKIITVSDCELDRELRRRHLRWMLAGRLVEERLRSLYRQGLIHGGVYLGFGQEALSAACGTCLQPGDVFAPLIRDMAGRLAFGEPIAEVLRAYLGRVTGTMRGRDGNIHRGDVGRGLLPMISHLGAMVPTALGVLMARRLRGESGSVAIAVVGDGAMNCGATHEGINAAAVHHLPLVVVVANNGYSYSTPNRESFACDDLIDRAAGYGVQGYACDATDPLAALGALRTAVDAARAGGGAQLVVGHLLRLGGHGEHDDARYVDPEQRATARDCLAYAPEQGLADDVLDAGEWDAWRAELMAEIDAALAQVEAEPEPTPADEDWRAYAGDWPGLEPLP